MVHGSEQIMHMESMAEWITIKINFFPYSDSDDTPFRRSKMTTTLCGFPPESACCF